MIQKDGNLNGFITSIRKIIDEAKTHAVRSIDHTRVMMYWSIGKRIFEEEQQGKSRADYGSYLIKNLSLALTPVYGSGFSTRQLFFCRKFYITYPIVNTLYSQLNRQNSLLMKSTLSNDLQIRTENNILQTGFKINFDFIFLWH